MHYLCSENKGADQLCGYLTADLRLCFRICKSRFSHSAAHMILTKKHYIDTRATSPNPTPIIRLSSGEELSCSTLFYNFGMSRLGIELIPPDLGKDTLPSALPRPVQTVDSALSSKTIV